MGTIMTRPKTNPMMEAIRDELDTNAREKITILHEHKSEFPSKLRSIIEEAWDYKEGIQNRPGRVLLYIEDAVREFFGGSAIIGQTTTTTKVADLSNSLHKHIDTEAQVETVLRFFPDIIPNTNFRSSSSLSLPTLYYRHPLYMMAAEPQGLSFVPVFVRVTMELFGDDGVVLPEHKLKFRFRTAARIILMDPRHGDLTKETTSDAGLALRSLLETPVFGIERFTKGEIFFDMMNAILKQQQQGQQEEGKGLSFLEGRLRFLIRWRPSLLKVCSDKPGRHLLVEMFSYHVPGLWKHLDKNLLLELYGVIVELGLEFYPKELGFVFHKHNDVYPKCCAIWGEKVVAKIVSDKLLATLHEDDNSSSSSSNNNNNKMSLTEMVVEAASSEDISLDGLYTLLRIDPIAVLQTTTSSSDDLVPR